MRCKFCGFTNGEDDHRCLRCGRRIGTAISAPAGFSGANALAVAPSFDANETQDFHPIQDAAPAQAALFRSPASNVIVFDPRRQATARLQSVPNPQPKVAKPPLVETSVVAPVNRREPPAPRHPELDFMSGVHQGPLLENDVPAQVYCSRAVATPTHRFVAGAMDAAMVLLGFGVFVGICEMAGAGFGTGKLFWIMMALSLTLITALYGLVFSVAGGETLGMHCTDLQLITFDGFPVDARTRAIRVAATWLSFCSAGLGLIWALADEETLTWQDHISKTFPTIRESSSTFHRL